jgi:hypothetical protein
MNKFNVVLLAALLAFAGTAAAQDGTTVNSTSNSQVQSGAASQASNAGNAQNIAFNSPQQPTRTTERVESAPSMALGSFGTSFSSDNCSNTTAAQVSLIGFGIGGGTAVLERSCSHIRQAAAFGNAVVLDHNINDIESQRRDLAMMHYVQCNTSDDNLQQCANIGLVKIVKRSARANDVTYVPAYDTPEQVAALAAAHQREIISDRPVFPDGTIPARPPGWTNKSMVQQDGH